MATEPAFTVRGDKELINKLKTAEKKIQKRVLFKAVNAGGKPIIKAARNKVPIRTGTLKKSLGNKAKNYDKGNTRVLIIGPRASVIDGYEGKVIRPVNYAHLVEKGFNHVKSGQFIEGDDYLEEAIESKQSESRRAIEEGLVKGIEKELSKGTI